MKNINKIFAIAIVALGFSTSAFAQSLSATANARAAIVTPISIAKVSNGDLNFGNLASSSTLGTAKIDDASLRTVTGGVTEVNGAFGAANFTVSGTIGSSYSVSIPSSSITVTNALDGTTMTVSSFTSNLTTAPATTGTGTIGVAGTQTIRVGATLAVAANQTAGTYTSSAPFTVSVNYN